MSDIDYEWDSEQYNNPWQDPELLEHLWVGDGIRDQANVKQKEVAEELGCTPQTISKWLDEYDLKGEQGYDYENIVLFSGGYDSLVMTHYVMEEMGIGDVVLHLDTGTGIPENEQFVIDVCEQFGWPLEIRSPTKTLKEFALDYGFPKGSSHSWAYRYFKEHTIQSFVTELKCDHPRLYTGVRRKESQRRMKTVEAEEQEADNGMWTWVSPIMHWSEVHCNAYREAYGLPENPVVEEIHRSGECYCGAFANRVEELVVLEAEYPDHAEWLLNLEEEVQEEIGTEEDYCWWGTSGMPSEDLQELMEGEDPDPVLCRDCEKGGEIHTHADD